MRKEKTVTIEAPATIGGSANRDLGKRFLITEMSAMQADAWAVRALGAMMRSGVAIPDEIGRAGLQGFAMYGLKAILAAPYAESAPLLAEVMGCVKIVEPMITRPLLESDIEEISTITQLRDEVIELHTGFSPAAVLLGAVASEPTTDPESTSSTTQT